MSDVSAPRAVIRVNGQDELLRAETVAGLLAEKEIPPDMRGIAVAMNGRVIPRARWAEIPLQAGDAVEIVLARQGG